MRRSIVIAVVLLAIAFLFVGGPSLLFSTSTDELPDEEAERQEEINPKIVSLEDSESGFWRFLSPREGFQQRSPINVIVRGDTDKIIKTMTASGEWSELNENQTDAESGTYAVVDGEREAATDTEWGEAKGSTRYAWIDPGNGEDGYWVDETGQLQDGDYYGQRFHIRYYEAPREEDQWVAMQTHTEHFDWFTLRHRVDGVQAAQSKIETEFMDHPEVDTQDDIRRVYLDNSNPSDSDGWATVVDLTSMIVLPAGLGLAARRRSRLAASAGDTTGEQVADRTPDALDDHLTDVDRQRLATAYDRLEAGHILLVFAILALFLGVRIGGIALERTAEFLDPHLIAGLLYPFIAVGIPMATYMIARGLTRRLDAAVVTSTSLALAIWLDYGLLGVNVIALDVVLQRMLLVVAIGLIAGGAAKRAIRESVFNDMLIAGVAMWVLVLAGTLLGYL